ncbi:MAG TPA: alpha/beta fold hydrolase, partial [Gemmatimonadaceae bacterium]
MIRTFRVRRAVVSAVFIPAVLPALLRAQQPAVASRFVGEWVGTLATPAAKLRLGLSVARDASSGGLTGVLTSLDQGNAKIPATLALHGDTLVVSMPAAQATYTAVLDAAKDSLRGTFTQGAPLPLDMGRSSPPTAPVRPQEPKPPFPYSSRDVTVESVPGVRLAGTILMPPGAGPFPAVVMVTGSGPQNRNEELLGHKPFLVIADYLARHGIASLRYDDRGIAASTGNFAASTSADFADDAQAAVAFLRKQPGIAPGHVGIIGHSEGGLIAPMVAARDTSVAFIVLLAGPGLPGDSILLLQGELIAKANNAPQAMIDTNLAVNSRLFAAVKGARDSADAAARVNAIADRMTASLPVTQQAQARTQLETVKAQVLAPWMQYFLKYDPRTALRQVRVPVLALDGSLDLQVPPKADLAAIDTTLKRAGNRDYEVKELPGLNHLFQTA